MGMTRMLLECSLSDKLCVIQEKQYEVIIVPTLLVTIFLILLGVILWLFIREQRTQQQRSGPQGIAPVPPPRDLSWEAGHGGNV
ncbi:serine/threonine/tyrosine kinase 1, partial [Homo sapiens]